MTNDDQQLPPGWEMVTLTTPSILERTVSRAKQTSGQRNLTLELSSGLPLPLAPKAEQVEIIRLAQFSLTAVEGLDATLPELESDLTHLNQSILAKAFRGELVPQDSNDEPACELLARIRQERENSGKNAQATKDKSRMDIHQWSVKVFAYWVPGARQRT